MDTYIIITGEPENGQDAYGPYPTRAAAEEEAGRRFGDDPWPDVEWNVLKLNPAKGKQ